MGRWDRVWSEELERGLLVAIVDGGLTAPKATRLALSGRLPNPEGEGFLEAPELEGVKPADMERRLLASARRWASDERRKRQGDDLPSWIRDQSAAQSIETLTMKLLGIAANEVAWIERQKRGKRDLDRARKAAQLVREAQALERKDAPTRSGAMRGAANGEKPPETETAEGSAAGLIALARRTATGETPRQDEPEHRGDSGHVDQTGPQSDKAEAERSGGILKSARGEHEAREREAAAELGIDLPTEAE